MKNPSCTSLEQKTDFPATYDTELLVLEFWEVFPRYCHLLPCMYGLIN